MKKRAPLIRVPYKWIVPKTLKCIAPFDKWLFVVKSDSSGAPKAQDFDEFVAAYSLELTKLNRFRLLQWAKTKKTQNLLKYVFW